ncbi:MAG: prolyl oligopeptidase family serine peptidase [Bacteroidales bacterium]|nr:prolyl oligopeptidase family serine peptidase [Bacteroidales bacterium]
MKNIRIYIMLGIVLTLQASCSQNQQTMEAPEAPKKPKELTIHGDTRIDNYYWLNERENPEVINYLEAENAYTKAQLKDTEDLQDSLFKEITARIKPSDESVPYFLNGYWYSQRYDEGKEHPVWVRKKEKESTEEEILLDGNKMAEGLAYFDLGSFAVSENNKLLAYSTDTVSRRKYTIFIKDLTTGTLLEDAIPNTTGNVVWANDNKTLFYTVKDESLRPYRIYKHTIGSQAENDELVFEEKDPTFTCDVRKSKSRKYIFIESESTVSDECRYADAGHPENDFRIIQPRQRGLEYSAAHHQDHFYILTNDDALNFRLMKTPVTATKKENWQEVIAHRSDVLIEDVEVFESFIALEERVSGLSEIRIVEPQKNADYYLDFDEEAYTVYTAFNPDFHAQKLRFKYTSLTTPPKTIEWDLATQKKQVLKETEVLGGYDPANYESKRFFAPAGDGTEIPVSMMVRKDRHEKPMPLLLYGYGSYGYSRDPYFSYGRISLLDRGFAFAIAHVRGGQEMGRQWYEDGKMLKKKNTFTDFNDVAEYLVAENYTTPDLAFRDGWKRRRITDGRRG